MILRSLPPSINWNIVVYVVQYIAVAATYMHVMNLFKFWSIFEAKYFSWHWGCLYASQWRSQGSNLGRVRWRRGVFQGGGKERRVGEEGRKGWGEGEGREEVRGGGKGMIGGEGWTQKMIPCQKRVAEY